MNTIATSYQITENTLALIPAQQIEYDTIVIKQNVSKNILMPSLKIIQNACLTNGWVTYEGRRQAVIHHTNFIQKTPIPICKRSGIYFFPTHSPMNIHNNWIAYQHVEHIATSTKPKQTTIHFKSGQTLTIDVSRHTLKSQLKRTFECVWRMKDLDIVFG